MNDKSTKSVSTAVSRTIAGEWETPDELFKELDRKYHFNLDACARPENAKCAKFFTAQDDGLAQDWKGHTVYCCPPSGAASLRHWVKKASTEAKKKNTVVVMLLPVSTDSKWFQENIYLQPGVRVHFLPERVKFVNSLLPSYATYGQSDKKPSAGMRPSMVVVFDGSKRESYRQEIQAAIASYDMTEDEYFQQVGVDSMDALLDTYADQIKESVSDFLIFQAVAEEQKIKVTDDDVNDYFGGDALSVKQAKAYYGEAYLNQNVLYEKVYTWLVDHASIV